MRTGGCTLQQALTTEAATMVKQSVSLARRRGHAQVTPLHVASTMLSSSTGLLRAACLRSHSHPLQCKALELCFNVALNRLPASTSISPLLGAHTTHPHHHHHHLLHPPTLSNALVAAFKRAQAHQRRGSVETQQQQQQQQQSLLAVKIEIEQLVISILDDPSVSRVMREAGFNSTQVKGNVEQALSLEFSSSSSPNSSTINLRKSNKEQDHGHLQLMIKSSPIVTPIKQYHHHHHHPRNDQDVKSVMDCLIGRKKRSIAVVGECLATTESVITGMMDRVERGEVPETLKGIQFITLPLFFFANLSRIEVEQKVGELRCLVKSCSASRGVVLYLGDLKWVAEYKAARFGNDQRSRMMISYYCPVEHVIMELGRMICNGGTLGEEGRFWLMGIATYQTYMRCRVGHPSLETIWGLHPLTVPVGSLGLSLSHDSYLQSPLRTKRSNEDGSQWSLPDDHREVEDNIIRTSSLPSWLQQCMETTKNSNSRDQENCIKPRDLFSKLSQNQTNQVCTVPLRPLIKEHQFWPSDSNSDQEGSEPNNSRTIIFHSSSKDHKKPRPTVVATTNSSSTDDDDDVDDDDQSMEMDDQYNYHPKFKELNAENLKTLCMALEKKVPWQVDIIPEISSTILQCRSGMVRRRDNRREDTWLFFQGCDLEGKNKIARELASLVYGSSESSPFVSLGWTRLSQQYFSSSSTKSGDSGDDVIISSKKRSRSETYLERFAAEIRYNPHRVFLLEEMEQVDYDCRMGIKRAMERGVVVTRGSNGEEEEGNGLQDAIVILSCESFDSRSRASSPPVRVRSNYEESHGDDQVVLEKEGSSSCGSLDLNLMAGNDDDQTQTHDDVVGLVDLVDRRFLFKIREEF